MRQALQKVSQSQLRWEIINKSRLTLGTEKTVSCWARALVLPSPAWKFQRNFCMHSMFSSTEPQPFTHSCEIKSTYYSNLHNRIIDGLCHPHPLHDTPTTLFTEHDFSSSNPGVLHLWRAPSWFCGNFFPWISSGSICAVHSSKNWACSTECPSSSCSLCSAQEQSGHAQPSAQAVPAYFAPAFIHVCLQVWGPWFGFSKGLSSKALLMLSLDPTNLALMWSNKASVKEQIRG